MFTCSPDNGDGNSIVVAIDGLLVSYCVVAFSIQQPTPTANHYLGGLFSINYRSSMYPQRKGTPKLQPAFYYAKSGEHYQSLFLSVAPVDSILFYVCQLSRFSELDNTKNTSIWLCDMIPV